MIGIATSVHARKRNSLVDPKTCLGHLEKATIANMVGKRAVQTAVNAGLVHEQAIIYIEGHPHAQWVKL